MVARGVERPLFAYEKKRLASQKGWETRLAGRKGKRPFLNQTPFTSYKREKQAVLREETGAS
jgi:hypothetical protein